METTQQDPAAEDILTLGEGDPTQIQPILMRFR